MATIASLIAEFGSKDTGFESKVDSVVHAIDKVDRKFQNIRKHAEKVEESFGALGGRGAHVFEGTLKGLGRLQGKLGVTAKSAYMSGGTMAKGFGFAQDAMSGLSQEALGMVTSGSRLASMFAGLGGPIGIVIALVLALTVGAAALAVVMGKKLVSALMAAADAAAEEDAILQGLEQALRRTGDTAARQTAEDFNKFASEMQRTTRFTDDMIVKAATLGVALGVPHERLKDVTKVAMDFATRTGKSLEDAMTGIAKAANGQGRILMEAGFKLDEAKLKAGGLDYVLGLLNSRMGGAAVDAAQNYEGRMIGLKNAYGDVVEGLGRFISKNETVNAIIVELTKVLGSLAQWFEENREMLSRWLDRFLYVFKIIAKTATIVIDKIIADFYALKAIFDLAAAGIVQFARFFTESINFVIKKIGQFLTDHPKIAKALGLEGVGEELVTAADKMNKGLEELQDGFIAAAAEGVQMWKDITEGRKGATAALERFVTNVMNTRAKIAKAGEGGGDAGAPLSDEKARLEKLQKMIERMQQSGMVGKMGGEQVSPETKALTEFSLQFGRAADSFEKSVITFGVRAQKFLTDLPKMGAGGAALAGAGSVAMGAMAQGNLGGVMQGAAQGGQAGGPWGALAGAIMALVTQSKQFAKLLEMVNEFLQVVADTLGELLAPLVPVFRELFAAITPILRILAPLIQAVTKLNIYFVMLQLAAKGLFIVMKGLFGAIRYIAIAILKAVKAVYKALGKSTKKIDKQIDKMKDMKFDDAAAAADDLADAAANAANELTNVPEGFKYALRKFQAMDPTEIDPGGGSHTPPDLTDTGDLTDAVDAFTDPGVWGSIFDPTNTHLADIFNQLVRVGDILTSQPTGPFNPGNSLAGNIGNLSNVGNLGTAFNGGFNSNGGGVVGQGATSGDSGGTIIQGDLIIDGSNIVDMESLMKSIEETTNKQLQRKHGALKPIKR